MSPIWVKKKIFNYSSLFLRDICTWYTKLWWFWIFPQMMWYSSRGRSPVHLSLSVSWLSDVLVMNRKKQKWRCGTSETRSCKILSLLSFSWIAHSRRAPAIGQWVTKASSQQPCEWVFLEVNLPGLTTFRCLCLHLQPTFWLQPHKRCGARKTQLSCSWIPDLQKLLWDDKCFLF